MGFNREALRAGHNPKQMPTPTEKTVAKIIENKDTFVVQPANRDRRKDAPIPTIMPTTPPTQVKIIASIRNLSLIHI